MTHPLTYETTYYERIFNLFHNFEILEVKHLFFTLLSELAREVCYARNYRIISPLGHEKFLLAGTDGKKFLKKSEE